MKKVFALALAVILLLSAALAEPAVFSLRNGIIWGMTPQEATATEPDSEYAAYEIDENTSGVRYESLPVAGVTGTFALVFWHGALRVCGYFLQEEDIPFAQLEALLTSKYGQTQEMDADRLARATSSLYDGGITAEEIADDSVTAAWWDLENGTIILLIRDDTGLALLYLDEATLTAGPRYTTDGL